LGGLAVIVLAAVGALVGHRSLERAENDGTILINLTAREQVAVVRYVRDVLAMSAGVESATADLTADLLATTAALRDGGVVEGFQGEHPRNCGSRSSGERSSSAKGSQHELAR